VHPRRRHHPVLVIVLAVFVAMAVAHAAGPWLLIGFLAAGVFLATRGARRSHPSQDR
jgi:hypothetical protein